MKHLDWLHPDHIILANSKKSSAYQEFTKHMRSQNFQNLRLLKLKDINYIRYQFGDNYFWYSANILQIRVKDYYIEIGIILSDSEKELENNYITLNREEKLNQLLK